MADDHIISRIMHKAAVADRRALFAALQAALGEITDMRYGFPRGEPYVSVEKAIDLGAEVGSPEHLAPPRTGDLRPGE